MKLEHVPSFKVFSNLWERHFFPYFISVGLAITEC